MHTTRILILLFVLSLIVSCKPNRQLQDYVTTWTQVKKVGDAYQLIDCGYPAESIAIAGDSVYHHGAMEDNNFKADHIRRENDRVTLYPQKQESSFYRFLWVNEERGIGQWQIADNGTVVSKYFVNEANLKNIKTVKGGKADCITGDDVGDRINDSLVIESGNKTLYVEDDNCLTIKNRAGNTLYENCFETVTLKIRHVKGSALPITFVSGSRSIDLDFYAIGDDWVSKTATYHSGEKREVKATKSLSVSIKDFDFDGVAGKFNNLEQPVPAALANLQNHEKLLDIDVYGIADILSASPVNKANDAVYVKAARELIEAEMYNEARIIMLEIVKIAPDNADNYLYLGDAQWGFEDVIAAKNSYRQFVSLMKTEGKGAEQIPQRVNDRLK